MLVSIYTQVYNSKPFLSRCIESVLRQTFPDFEYILIDNGSTDGCKELVEEYAAKDKRIQRIRFEENRPAPIWLDIARERTNGAYVMELDSDDWYEPDCLERMLRLAEQHRLDIVCTGTAFHSEGREAAASGARSLPQRLMMDRGEFAAYFPYYHAFFRTVWGKLIRREVFMSADLSVIDRENVANGADTLAAFAWLRRAGRVCIDNSVLHHYLLRRKSVSRIYLPNRFQSNTVLHQDALDFLAQYGPVSRQNLHFLHIVYANAVSDTLDVLRGSELSPEEKLREYCRIAEHPATMEAYRDRDEAIARSRRTLLGQILASAAVAHGAGGTLSAAAQALCPRCGAALDADTAPLFLREPALREALVLDDWDKLAEILMRLILEKRYTRQFDLGRVLARVVPPDNPLGSVSDTRFFRAFPEICMLTLCGNYLPALERMTELLVNGGKIRGEELFLRLYEKLARLEGQEAAVVFGKIRLARLCLREKRPEECRTLLEELSKMGVEDGGELAQLRKASETAEEEGGDSL